MNYVTLMQKHVIVASDIPSDIVDKVAYWFEYFGGTIDTYDDTPVNDTTSIVPDKAPASTNVDATTASGKVAVSADTATGGAVSGQNVG
ncbi:hypothetical protein [Lactobacillus amylolyticus]|uniref:hypothetical protein n=1 Tax=Lactobacillus amylolyticus TaxID=83683 RepID=UPI0024922A49|nr:hypothetical protein [Lactobacillus amylolyticus]